MAYEQVNNQWPDTLPALTGPEALAAAKRLYRFGMKRAYRGKWKLVSGNRFTWQRSMVFSVNPNRTGATRPGWHDLVHMMSHYCHQRLHPKSRPHAGAHHFLEKEMVAYVISQGWLEGKLRKPEATRPDVAEVRRARTLEGIKRWEAKRKRADTALKKLRRRAAYYERRCE